ncbi:VWA domain-containing protein [Lentzea sp. NPDC060358]|uniref:VWA domain-containing protein n=1 Tax=Lentzea sp. NPDC060358 TaxID=3347103 RepID=UPI003650622F
MTAQPQPAFDLEVSQNAYLFAGETEMHAVLTVTAEGLEGLTGREATTAAEVIAIDCSGSMHSPPTKLRAAQDATAAAIDALREGVFFAVVEGTHTARVVYPPDGGLVAASTGTRAAAKHAVRRLAASGGTALGAWLRLADQLLAAHPTAVRHVLLLTDGKNEHETSEELDAVLAECSGRFVCDARGVGDGWEPEELLRIVSALNGTADAVREETGLAEDFTAIMRAAMRKVLPELLIRIETSPFARVRFLRQTFPTRTDLTALGTSTGPRTTSYPTGSWGEESRDFHVCLDVRPDGLDLLEYQIAEVGLVPVHTGLGQPAAVTGTVRPIVAQWTENTVLSTVLDSKVAHATNQAELGRAVMAGSEAYDAGDVEQAAAQWGRAVALASAQHNEKVLSRLLRLVDVVGDPARGEVRVRTELQLFDLKSLSLSRNYGTRGPDDVQGQSAGPPPAGPDLTCTRCRRVSSPGTAFCENCGKTFEATA